MQKLMILVFVGVAFIFILILKSLKTIDNVEIGIVERSGTYKCTLYPGRYFLNPFIDKVIVLSAGEQQMEFVLNKCVSKDSARLGINSVIKFIIFDPQMAVYGVDDSNKAFDSALETSFKNIIESHTLDELIMNQNEITKQLIEDINKITNSFGVRVNDIDLVLDLISKVNTTDNKEPYGENPIK